MSLQIAPVFVSSTWLDLRPEREAVERAVQRLRETKFVGMEHFGSRDSAPRAASLAEIDSSSVYVGIVASRYGSGITEAEYERARQNGLPCLVYFKDPAKVPAEWRETEPAQLLKLDAFKRKLRANHLNAPDFNSPEDLAAKVTADLHRWLFDEYLTPRLRRALRDELPRGEAQTLLDAVQDFGELSRDLLAQLRGKGFRVSVGGDFVAGDKFVYNAAPVIFPTLHQLRAPVGDFVGRAQEAEELLSTLRGGSDVITGVSRMGGISGMGGVGKTELAYYVAARLRNTYPDAQLVLDMRGSDAAPRDPADALASCVRAFLGLEQHLPDDAEQLTLLYRSVLEGRRALILLDNAYDGAQVRPFLPPEGSALLITSRNRIALPGMKMPITLDQLSHTEARALLTGIAPRVPADTADRICYLCGHLPLAIRAAGSLLAVAADLDPKDYAAQLHDERTRLERIGAEGVDVSVEASFNLSYARLSPDAARVFRQLSVFPASFNARAEVAVCEDEDHKHLSDLVRRSLALHNADGHRYHLHDLVRIFAGSRPGGDEAELGLGHLRHAMHYLSVLEKCNEIYNRGSEAVKNGLALFDAERRNVEAGQEWARLHSNKGKMAAWLCNKYPSAGANVLHMRQHPRERILWCAAGLAAARQLGDRAGEASHMGGMAMAYFESGETRRAVELNGQALAVLREIGTSREGGNPSSTEGTYMGNVGAAYAAMGQTRLAIKFYEQALAILRKAGNRSSEGLYLSNMGGAYAELGDTRFAVKCYEQALAAALETGDRRGEGHVLIKWGAASAEAGEPSPAVKCYKQALAILREVGDRRGEGQALNSMGLAYAKLGETRRAIETYEQGLTITREIGDAITEGRLLVHMGLACAALGRPKCAVKFYEQALAVSRVTGDRRNEANAHYNTAVALGLLDDRANAIAHAEAALGIYEQIESPDIAKARAVLNRWLCLPDIFFIMISVMVEARVALTRWFWEAIRGIRAYD